MVKLSLKFILPNLFFWGFILLPTPALAEFSFSIPQTTITDEQELDVAVTISLQGQGNKIYYIEAAFKKEGGTNYFGLTWNDSSWVKYTASNFSSLKSITTDATGKWNGTLKAKIDKGSSLYTGSGNYIFQIKRFTSSGSSSYWSDNNLTLTVNPSLSPSPTPTPIPPPSSSSNPTSPTSSFTISNTPSQIDSDQSFTVSVNLSLPNNPNTNFYLKGAFKKSNSSNYFGYTKVNGNWVKNSSIYSSQYSVTTDSSGNWSGNLEVQPYAEDSGYTGTDDYIFKVGRYTSSGSGPTWSSESNVKIVSVEVSSDQQVSQTTKSSKSINNSSSSISITPQSKSIISISSSAPKLNYQIASVAAAKASTTPSGSVEVKGQKKSNFIPLIGMALMIAGLSSLIFTFLKKSKRL